MRIISFWALFFLLWSLSALPSVACLRGCAFLVLLQRPWTAAFSCSWDSAGQKQIITGFGFHHNVVSTKRYLKYIRYEIKLQTIGLTCSLGFLLGVAMATSCGISSSSSSSSCLPLFSPSPEDSVGLVTSSSSLFCAAIA